MKRSRKRRSGKISDAVFLGRKAEYTFEVYPFAAEIRDSPAVFILSRRKVNKTGHASHAASCIGETDSIVAELKKHKRAKCVKHNDGNVICILREDSDKNRAAVLNDIKDARMFSCIRGLFEPTMLRKPNVHKISATKNILAKLVPSPALPLKPVRRKRIAPAPVQTVDESKGAKAPRASVVAADGKRAGSRQRAVTTAKPAKAASVKPKGSKTAAPKRVAAKPRTRVQGGVDRDRGQHRLPKQKGAVRGRAKAGTAGSARTRKKAAA